MGFFALDLVVALASSGLAYADLGARVPYVLGLLSPSLVGWTIKSLRTDKYEVGNGVRPIGKPGMGVGRAMVVLLLVIAIMTTAFAAYIVVHETAPGVTTITSISGSQPVVTSNPSAYFPQGYYSHLVNLSSTHNGDLIVIGSVSFLYVTPTNLETRTMTVGPPASATTTVAVVTADYQCGTSMGQQRVFFVQSLSSEAGNAVKLDYCLVLNTAISQGAYQGGVPHPWGLWEVSTGVGPAVAIHMTGNGEEVSSVELCVEK